MPYRASTERMILGQTLAPAQTSGPTNLNAQMRERSSLCSGSPRYVRSMAKDPPEGFTLSIRNLSPQFWITAVERQVERLEAAQREMVATGRSARADRSVIPRLYTRGHEIPHEQFADTQFLLVAIRHILRLRDRYRSSTEDQRLIDASEAFDEAFPHARDLRDILEHLDDYAEGIGRLQTHNEVSPDTRSAFLFYRAENDPAAEIELWFGADRRVALKAAAKAAIDLARLLDEIYSDDQGSAE